MMKEKKSIPESEFLNNVTISDVLDEGESWEEYKKANSDIKFYKSGSSYFFQTAGFEFIWSDYGN